MSVKQVFGSTYAAGYDALYQEKDYDGEVDLLDGIFRRYARRPVRDVLDLGCGTGNHALRLAAKGYRLLGIDRSMDMLEVAQHKSPGQLQNVRFEQADIRRLNLSARLDAVLMMFGVLGYQLEDADVLDALRGARRHLRPDGLLVFDVWYGPAVLAQGTQERVRTIRQNGTIWKRKSSGTLEPKRNLCHVEFDLQRMEGGRVLTETKECHAVRYFFPEEIGRFLDSTGFRLLRLGAFPAIHNQPSDGTWNVMAVAAAA